jgi:hypothetical protein
VADRGGDLLRRCVPGLVRWAESGHIAGYENDYIILVRIQDGLLKEIRE